MQIRQRIFNCIDTQIMHFILDKILKFLTYHTPFYRQSLQSYLISKTVWFFGPPCIVYCKFLLRVVDPTAFYCTLNTHYRIVYHFSVVVRHCFSSCCCFFSVLSGTINSLIWTFFIIFSYSCRLNYDGICDTFYQLL